MLIFIAVLGYCNVVTARLFARYASIVDRRWLRCGLRLLAVNSAINLLFCACVAVLLVAARLDLTAVGAAVQRVEPLVGSTGILISAVGTMMPALGPRLDRIVAYHRLHPLWLAIYRTVPELVLAPPRWPRADRWNVWDVNFRLYRRIIEIRDGRLALRPYFDAGVAEDAHRRAADAGLDQVAQEAVIEAATLAAAIEAKATGRRPVEQPPSADGAAGGGDLATELSWLTQVAKAFVSSAIVAAARTGRGSSDDGPDDAERHRLTASATSAADGDGAA
jgi:hypothetical protein